MQGKRANSPGSIRTLEAAIPFLRPANSLACARGFRILTMTSIGKNAREARSVATGSSVRAPSAAGCYAGVSSTIVMSRRSRDVVVKSLWPRLLAVLFMQA